MLKGIYIPAAIEGSLCPSDPSGLRRQETQYRDPLLLLRFLLSISQHKPEIKSEHTLAQS